MIPIAIGIVLPRLNDAVGQGIKFVVADSLVLPCLLEGGSQAGKSPTSCSCKTSGASVADDTTTIDRQTFKRKSKPF